MQQKDDSGSRVFVSRVECDIIFARGRTLVFSRQFVIINYLAHKTVEAFQLSG